MSDFKSFNLRPSLIETLESLGIRIPTDIQHKVIPLLLDRQSLVGVAETGSGKTLAYALPLLHLVKEAEEQGGIMEAPSTPWAAVVVPTRELGEQVARVLKSFTHTTRLRVRTILGDSTKDAARQNVKGAFEILIATPGRLLQLLERRGIGLHAVRHLVLDEADQLLEMGFLKEVARIVDGCAPGRQISLFSATIPHALESLINEVFERPRIIRTRGSHHWVPELSIQHIRISPKLRFEALEPVLDRSAKGSTLVFVNTRAQCDALVERLQACGWTCSIYRGEMDKVERRKNLRAFREGEVELLIATDLAARGLDLETVSRVVNYYLPHTVENYLHRVGRTARAGSKGLVVNLVAPADDKLLQQLEQAKPPRARM